MNPDRLKPDCGACDALCCVSPSLDLPHYKKPPGQPCRNLDPAARRCRIFDTLEAEGFPFCRTFDCHGAGPAVTAIFRDMDRTWQTDPGVGKVEFDVFNLVFAELHDRFEPGGGMRDAFPPSKRTELAPFVAAAFDWLAEPGD